MYPKTPFHLTEKIPFPKTCSGGFPLTLLLDRYLCNLLPVSPLHSELAELLFARIGMEPSRRLLRQFVSSKGSSSQLEKIQEAEDTRDLLQCIQQIVSTFSHVTDEKALREFLVCAVQPTGKSTFHRPADYLEKLKRVGTGLGLAFHELEILEFAICYEMSGNLMSYCDQYMTSDWPYLISQALGLSPEKVQDSIGGEAGLLKKGVLRFKLNDMDVFEPILHYLMGLRSDFLDPDTCSRVEPSSYPLESFPVAAKDLDMIQRALCSAGRGHILLYGRPGTGKTELAKALAHQGGYEPLLVSCGKDGTPQQRLVAITTALAMASDRTLFILDEADALLNTPGGFYRPGVDKSWVNHFLDTCPHKVIWITNDVSDIPASVLRRFTYSQPFEKFTNEQRCRTWEIQLRQQHMAPWLSDQAVQRLSHNFQTDAGAIASAVDATRRLYDGKPPKPSETEETLQRLLNHHLRLSGLRGPGPKKRKTPTVYDPKALNTDVSPDRLLESLRDYNDLRSSEEPLPPAIALFWGLPGTGKTQLATYLAEKLGRPLIQKRMSDLQSKYLGETEQQIAAAFREAEQQQGILLLDEADSLFLDRTTVQRSWESSQTNEVLTQMENFEGICICCTNLLNRLDRAALRRFTWKVEFKALDMKGRERLYRRYFQPRGRIAGVVRERLKQMHQLTPGDFKVVSQQLALHGKHATREALLDALDLEQSYKSPGSSEPIGFGSAISRKSQTEPVQREQKRVIA